MSKKSLVITLMVVVAIAIGVFAQIQTPNNISLALEMKANREAFRIQAQGYGLSCYFQMDDGECRKMILRAESNSQLKAALLEAKSAGVFITVRSWPWFDAGSVGEGSITLNNWATDESIIAFLTN